MSDTLLSVKPRDARLARIDPTLDLEAEIARLEEELQLIGELGLAGFFLLHWEVLELARDVAIGVRGHDSPRGTLPPGRGRGSSVGSIVCYLTGLSHVDPVKANLSLGRFLNDELVAVPDIDLDFPRDIRERLIVAVTERYGNDHGVVPCADHGDCRHIHRTGRRTGRVDRGHNVFPYPR